MARIVVNTTEDVVDADDGVLSLREAILAANETERHDTIVVSRTLDGPLIVEDDLPDIEEDLTFDGNGALIEHGNEGVFATGRSGLDLSFEDFATDGIATVFAVDSTDQTISIQNYTHAELTQSGDDVVDLQGSGHTLDVRNSTFRAVNDDAVIDVDSNETQVSLRRVEMDLSDGSEEGIEVDGHVVTVDVRRSSFVGNENASIDGDGAQDFALTVVGSLFQNNDIAIRMDTPGMSARLINNDFFDNNTALQIEPGDATLFSLGNDFERNGIAINIESGAITQSLRSLFDDFEGNGTAINNDSDAGTFEVRFADFDDNLFDLGGFGDTDLGPFL